MDVITFTTVVKIRRLIELEKPKLKIDAAKQHILITDEEIEELAKKMKQAIQPGMKKIDVSPRIAQTIKVYFESLIQQSE